MGCCHSFLEKVLLRTQGAILKTNHHYLHKKSCAFLQPVGTLWNKCHLFSLLIFGEVENVADLTFAVGCFWMVKVLPSALQAAAKYGEQYLSYCLICRPSQSSVSQCCNGGKLATGSRGFFGYDSTVYLNSDHL